MDSSMCKRYRGGAMRGGAMSPRLAVACLWMCCVPCAPSWSATLTVAVSRTPLSLPLYLANAKGYFEKEGLSVAMTDCVGGHRCLKMLLDGKAEMATVGDVPLMFGGFQKGAYAILATFSSSRDDLKLIAAKGQALTQPAQLEGKRIGVTKGSGSQYFLDTCLLLFGIPPARLTTVPMQPEEMPSALSTGRVDLVVAWEPYAFEAVRASGGKPVLPQAAVYTVSFNLVMRPDLQGRRDAEAVAFLKALHRAIQDIQRDPGQAKALLKSRLGADQQLIDWVWPGLLFELSLNQAMIRTLESQARWAIREGHVPAQAVPNYLDHVYIAPLRSFKADAVGLEP